jgi:hypothetical protein
MAKNKNQPKLQTTKHTPQAISDEDYISGAIKLGQRLTRHLSALENGEPGAVDDVGRFYER